jgi:hypothetical protein
MACHVPRLALTYLAYNLKGADPLQLARQMAQLGIAFVRIYPTS